MLPTALQHLSLRQQHNICIHFSIYGRLCRGARLLQPQRRNRPTFSVYHNQHRNNHRRMLHCQALSTALVIFAPNFLTNFLKLSLSTTLLSIHKPMKYVVLFLLAVVITACGGDKQTETLRPAQGGKFYGGIFRNNENGELNSLDPVRINDATSSHIAEQIYDHLMSFDANLQLKPGLAERFEISPDGLVYTYYLRKGVKFHDNKCFPGGKGREFTAEDVRYSFTRVCDARTQTKGYAYFKGKVQGAEEYFKATEAVIGKNTEPAVSGVSGFEVVDPYTFRIKLLQAFAPFQYYVTLSACFIHPREAVEYYKEDFFKNPVGTGPFVFESWAPDRELITKRNPVFWGKDEHGNQLPLLDGVRFSFIKDDKTQLLELKQGNLEESYRVPNEVFSSIVDANKKPIGEYANFQLLHVPAMSSQFYGMLVRSQPFTDKRVRQAISYAIDRDRIIRFVLKGQAAGAATHGLVPPSMPGYPTDKIQGYNFDREKARALLAEAGYPDGKNFPAITLQYNAGGGRNTQVAEAVQAMLKENLNITLELKQIEWARHIDEIDKGAAPFFRLGWVADYPDPETFLNLLYGKIVPESGISPINATRYQNAEFDRLFEEAIKTQDNARRMELYSQAEQIAIGEAPMLLIFYDEDYRFLQPYVMGYINNAMDRRYYRYVWFDPSKMK